MKRLWPVALLLLAGCASCPDEYETSCLARGGNLVELKQPVLYVQIDGKWRRVVRESDTNRGPFWTCVDR